ncbi:hypothetical protein DYD21_16105 [Rhodohalobacter sp. SW132]|nr:hypothetical protein DYD21_16105 [Rhodohalobacter sp. SW132]
METEQITLLQPDGTPVPHHFHITEAGLATKHFIDCGGTLRKDESLTMQVWVANDTHHRLTPSTLLKILDKAAPLLNSDEIPVEIEYQSESNTIGKYRLGFNGDAFQLIPTQTECLALDQCGMDVLKKKAGQVISATGNGCEPNSGCC